MCLVVVALGWPHASNIDVCIPGRQRRPGSRLGLLTAARAAGGSGRGEPGTSRASRLRTPAAGGVVAGRRQTERLLGLHPSRAPVGAGKTERCGTARPNRCRNRRQVAVRMVCQHACCKCNRPGDSNKAGTVGHVWWFPVGVGFSFFAPTSLIHPSIVDDRHLSCPTEF